MKAKYEAESDLLLAFSNLDEIDIYKSFRKKYPQDKNSLKILLVGELAYNAERIYALEEAGHQLYGLWMTRPTYTLNTVGYLPFGNVEDIPPRSA
jgi:hypothetical protein